VTAKKLQSVMEICNRKYKVTSTRSSPTLELMRGVIA